MIAAAEGPSAYTKSGGVIAPYWRFRPTQFYEGTFLGGTYTGDIMWCPWTCDNCWSQFGWTVPGGAGPKPRYELSPEEVVTKLIAGMVRNGQQAGRISGGEPSMYWNHMAGTMDAFMEMTDGKRIRLYGRTGASGVPMHLIFETNGSLTSLKRIDEIQERYGSESCRLALHFGLKATDPEKLSELTGLAPAAAAAAHKRQLRALLHVAANTDIEPFISVLDKYSDPEAVSALAHMVEEARPGLAENVAVLQFKPYRAGKLYTPKRHRQEQAA